MANIKYLAKKVVPILATPFLKINYIQRGLDGFMHNLSQTVENRHNKKRVKAIKRLRLCQRLVALLYSRPYYREVTLGNGIKIMVDTSDTLGLNLFYGGSGSDSLELNIIEQLLSLSDTAIDIGANIGLYTITIARSVGNKGKVYSFEPVITTFEILQKNVSLNALENVVLSNKAVSDTTGTAELIVTAESGLASLGNTSRGTAFNKVRVATTTVDDYVQQNCLYDIKFIKIDVEGFEGHVLQGAEKTLAKETDLILMVELSDENFSSLGFKTTAVIEWLKQQGYKAYLIDRTNKTVASLNSDNLSRGVNFLFARADSLRMRKIQNLYK